MTATNDTGLRARLRALSGPDLTPHELALAAALADRMPVDNMTPQQLKLVVSLLFYDLGTGTSGFVSRVLPSKLLDLPPVALAALSLVVPDLIRRAGGDDLASAMEEPTE